MSDSKRLEGETIQEWLNRVSIKDSKWLEEFKWREENEYWLKQSFTIAIKILSAKRSQNISKEQLEEMCGFEIGNILKGKQDMTLSQLCKLQDVLHIDLINVKINKKKPKFVWLSKLMSYICKK